ncbi:uncharacterized protein LOC117338340 isoform X2 [Pecten maximus]|uniref:uncharacterized protein LOC117338340 isoform X2 n=1 Tax=Pecten maximus TaxID=6579 RepID=UPI00145888C3|nr:uncharacterized protein LOC117338340 isoform X2 [Pecten maximus]
MHGYALRVQKETRANQEHNVTQTIIVAPKNVNPCMHVETRADGSLVREVTDGQVIIRAVFSTEAVQNFRAELEDSDSCPVEWNQALLLVIKYRAEFRPHRNLAQCEFVLHIDLFRLWDLKEGFFRKRRLVYSDEDARIQKKTKELWEEKQIEWQIEEEKKNSKPTESCPSQQNESTVSVSLTQLLQEMAKDADNAPTPQDSAADKQGTQIMMTRQNSEDVTVQHYTQHKTVKQDNEKELAGKEEDKTVHRKQDETTKQATQRGTDAVCEGSDTQDLRRPFVISELLIPEEEKLILEEIAEWKEGYMPERSVTTSSEEAGSGERVESYVPHTMVDDISSIETAGQPSPPKTGRSEFEPKERADNQEKSEVSCVPQTSPEEGSGSGSPQQAGKSTSPKKGREFSTKQNISKAPNLPLTENDTALGKTVNLCTGVTNSQLENTPTKTQSSNDSSNNSGPFQVCDFLESQGFIPCLSEEKGPNSTSDTSREGVTNIANVVSSPESNKSLEALEMEEERRLEKAGHA